TMKTAGTQWLSVGDDTAFAFAGEYVTVTPAAPSTFSIVGPTGQNSGATSSFTLTATDPYGNLATNYTGTVHFGSSDAAARLPGDYTFTDADQGMHSFDATLRTAGSQTVTATDAHSPAIKGQTSVSVLPVASLSGPSVGGINQTLTFTLSANGGPSASSVYTFQLDWNGDGVIDQTVSGVSGTTVTHSFASAGTTNVRLTPRFNRLPTPPPPPP